MTRTILRTGVVVVAVALGTLQWRAASERAALTELRTETAEARTEARACRQALLADEAEFRVLAGSVDSLRAVVDTLEQLDPRGVPAPRYEEYLETVEAFNEGVERWEAETTRLREDETACRTAVDRYNGLADSVRAVLGQSPGT
jgi:anti-sigma factor ChrR (cupin superfamily)